VWFPVHGKQEAAHDDRNRINNEKSYIKTLLMPRNFLVIGDVEKQPSQFMHTMSIRYVFTFAIDISSPIYADSVTI